MTAVPLGYGAYERQYSGSPEIKLLNRFLEVSPANIREGTSLLARPGTELVLQLDSDPGFYASTLTPSMRGNYAPFGLFSDSLFTVCGPNLYQISTSGTSTNIPGTVHGSNRPEVAWQKGIGYERLWIADGTKLQFYDGVTIALQNCPVPGGQIVSSLTQLNGYVLLSIENSQIFYWIKPGETTIDALDFASKESSPDAIIHLRASGDQLLIIGGRSTETWYATGDANSPFAPNTGRVYSRGAVFGTPVVVDEGVILVGDDGRVYSIGLQSGDATDVGWGVARVSNNGIEERIRRQIRREQGLTP